MKLVLGLFCCLCVTASCFSQATETIHLLKYTQKDGLPSYNVRKIYQDSKGFVWAGTQDGVSRFDGRTFINYSKSALPKHRICGVDVREITEDTANNLIWVLPAEVGLNAIDAITGEVKVTAPVTDAGTEEWNICLFRDNNLIMVGTSTGVRVFDTRKNQFIQKLPLPAPPLASTDFEARCIVKDAFQNYWVGYSGFGIVVYDATLGRILAAIPLSQLNDHNKSRDIRFYKALPVHQQQILFATSQGLRKIGYTNNYRFIINNQPCLAFPALNTESVDYVYAGDPATIYVAGYSRLFKFDSALSRYTQLKESQMASETDWLTATQCIYNDRHNNLWLGCQEGLAFISNKASPFTAFNYDKVSNIKLDHVRSVCKLANNDILVGLRSGLVHISNASGRYTGYDTGHLYHHIFQDKNGTVIASRADGLYVYNNGRLLPVDNDYPEFRQFASFSINSHLFVNDTTVILGTESSNGILVWNPVKRKVQQIGPGASRALLTSGIVNNIYKDSKGNIWVLSDNVINVLSPGFTKSREIVLADKTTGFDYKLFFDMCETNGAYFIASYGAGILQLDSTYTIRRIINTGNNLSNDGVYQVYAIASNKLLVTTNSGLSYIDLDSNRIKNFYARDGLHSNSFEEVAGAAKDGFIYAGGLRGFTIINPALITYNRYKPQLYIDGIVYETADRKADTANLHFASFTFPNTLVQATVYFSGINYASPERTTYKYKIAGLHPEWIDLFNQNFVTLIGLSPGKYTLQVQAFNEDGVPGDIKEIALTFLPKWYQTWLFKIAVVLLAAGAGYSLYRYRISQVRKREQIRKQISTDLHDDIGSTLNGIKIFSNLALLNPEKQEYVAQIKEGIQSAIISTRDMMWVLDDKQDTVSDLISRFEQFAGPLAEANQIRLEKHIDHQLTFHLLKKEEKRNLYLILKEAFNNCIKYAGCSTFSYTVQITKSNKIKVIINDNGKGFDPGSATAGNGLRNMEYRAGQIGYAFSIESFVAKGTSIYISQS